MYIQEPKNIAQSPRKTGSFQMTILFPHYDELKSYKTAPIMVHGLYQNTALSQTTLPLK